MAKTTPLTDATIAFLLITGMCSGMSLACCGFVVLTEGPSFRLTGDHDRQRFLAFVSFMAAIFGLLGNGLEEGKHGANAGQSTMSFFFNYCVQIGLVVIVHNTVIRFLAAHTRRFSPFFLQRASQLCIVLYLLPLPVLAPTLIALTHPGNTDVKVVARYMNITFVCVVEALATFSDIYLLARFTEHKTGGERIKRKMMREMWVVYACIWASILADVAAKITRNETGLLIADLTITNLTLSLRAMANIKYGATLKLAQEKYMHALSGSGASGIPHSMLARHGEGTAVPMGPPPAKGPLARIDFTRTVEVDRDSREFGDLKDTFEMPGHAHQRSDGHGPFTNSAVVGTDSAGSVERDDRKVQVV
ncbi:hypothetical protein FIBSPDRAFT_1037842 [Athelia psychrophila]|uniref:Uncharacterized protein n=1 Tax=Athelia psychrophila TaxID=1759441 RepID=A0A166TR19_9AGAM|nr:hypothetical protein FIBSPDRAFT_1037842 [Fibularhizoctonia sp. CBS 109695]